MSRATLILASPSVRDRARPVIVSGDMATVTLTQGMVATIDASDIDLVNGWNWSALMSPRRKAVYAARVIARDGKQTMLLMHRVIIGAEPGLVVDHRDGDGLNNRQSNLRLCSRADNALNTGRRADNKSGFKGVFFDARSGKWRAEIRRGGRSVHLGLHEDPEEAYARYCAAAHDIHGEFARLE